MLQRALPHIADNARQALHVGLVMPRTRAPVCWTGDEMPAAHSTSGMAMVTPGIFSSWTFSFLVAGHWRIERLQKEMAVDADDL